MNVNELEALLREQGYEDESIERLRSWERAGITILVYRNEDLGHHGLGHVLACSWDEDRKASFGEPPKYWPFNNTGNNGPGWRYVLNAVLEPEVAS